MKTRSLSIKIKTILLSIVLPSVLVLGLGTVLFFSQFNQYMEGEQDLLEALSQNIQESISLELSANFEMLRSVSVSSDVQAILPLMGQVPSGLDNDDYLDLPGFAGVQDYLDRLITGTGADLLYIASTGSTGLILNRDVQLAQGFDVRGRDYYQLALASPNRPVISEPRISAEQSAEPIIVVTAARSVPLRPGGSTAGIVALNYRMNRIVEILREQMTRYDVLVTLVDTTGEYLLYNAGPEGDYFFDPQNRIALADWLDGILPGAEEVETLAARVSAGQSDYFEGTTALGPSLIQTVPVGETRWSVAVATSRSEVVARVLSSLLPPILIFVAVFLLAQVVVFILYYVMVVKPLTTIGGNLQMLAEADADLTVQVAAKNDDEIGRVADSFNRFVEKLRRLMLEVKQAIDRTDRIKNSVAESTSETTSSIEEISANLASIEQQIAVLDTNISENVAAIEQVTRNITAMDDQILNQSAMVEQSTSAITQMIASLNNVNAVAQNKRRSTQALAEVARDGRTKIEDTSAGFRSVVDQISQIQEMAAAISNIASQTNLLSMNAAIEAAHAGDSGRGFAVVAEEIRKLADSAAQSSQSISSLISGITQAVAETDVNVNETNVAFEKIQNEVTTTVQAFEEIEAAVSELHLGGQQILDASNEINDVTVNIKSGSSEITKGTSRMLESSSRIKEVSQRVSTGMAEASSGAGEIVHAMQILLSESRELTEIVEALKEHFGRFRT